jgi:hypothetical protein
MCIFQFFFRLHCRCFGCEHSRLSIRLYVYFQFFFRLQPFVDLPCRIRVVRTPFSYQGHSRFGSHGTFGLRLRATCAPIRHLSFHPSPSLLQCFVAQRTSLCSLILQFSSLNSFIFACLIRCRGIGLCQRLATSCHSLRVVDIRHKRCAPVPILKYS